MKIQWIVNNINQVSGIERVVIQLSNFFTYHGYDTEIISLYTKEGKLFFDLHPDVKIIHCKSLDDHSRIGIVSIIHQIAKKSDADIVLGCHEYICNAMIINKPFFKGKVIATQHAAIEWYTKKRLILGSLILRFADRFVVLSQRSKHYYENWRLKNCIVIPNALNQKMIDIQENREKTIITAGRLTGVKGFDFLIRSFKLVHNVYPDWKLKILGDGEDKKKLTALIEELKLEDAVILPGFKKNVLEEFRKASIFAVTSENEGFSMVLLEAMSQGLALACVDIPVMNELLDCGRYGVLTSRDEEAFASALNSMIADEQLRNDYGEKALERSKDYSMEKIGMQWLELFQELSEKK